MAFRRANLPDDRNYIDREELVYLDDEGRDYGGYDSQFNYQLTRANLFCSIEPEICASGRSHA